MKKIFVAGLFGGVVMTLWLFVSNAILPIKHNLVHQRLPLEGQLALHGALVGTITETGTYSVPYLSREDEAQFPDYRNQPIYSIIFEGSTHGAGSPPAPIPFVVIFVTSLLVAWMLASAGDGVLSRYYRRVLFVTAIGVVIALADDVLQMSFGPQPKDYLTFLAVNNVITWLLAGLVIGWRVRGQHS
jgi:hypothetical protein